MSLGNTRGPLTPADLRDYAACRSLDDLRAEANAACEAVWGNRVFVRGLVEISNHCAMDCLYCGIRCSNQRIARYRLFSEEIVALAREGYARGIRTFVLQGGEDPAFSTDDYCRMVEGVRNATGGEAAVTLSLGIRPRSHYAAFKNAGADRYLLRFETSDEALHTHLRGGVPYARRLQALFDLKELGFEVGSGFMTGLPGESETTFYNNILLCRELELDMVGVGPFIPHPDTPLRDAPAPSLEPTLQAVALVRLLLPYANIPATTAAGSMDPLGREKMLTSGANVLMPNLSPIEAKQRYRIYPGKICIDESSEACLEDIRQRVASVGKVLSFERGDSKSVDLRRAC
ncbi:MAG: [FeFe] hydrogenase H-cluster radical SAM maturase HydE [Desulfomicrobiaceae bacterium]